MIEVKNLRKSFGKFLAVDDLSFDVKRQRLRAEPSPIRPLCHAQPWVHSANCPGFDTVEWNRYLPDRD